MEEIKHTPGKWKVVHSQSKNAWNVINTSLGCKYKIARFPYEPINITGYDDYNTTIKEEARQNALLFAEAPNMKRKLDTIIKALSGIGDAITDDIIKIAKN
jgi:hypothetical protein